MHGTTTKYFKLRVPRYGPLKYSQIYGAGGGGHSTFFQVGVCGLDFRSVGLAN